MRPGWGLAPQVLRWSSRDSEAAGRIGWILGGENGCNRVTWGEWAGEWACNPFLPAIVLHPMSPHRTLFHPSYKTPEAACWRSRSEIVWMVSVLRPIPLPDERTWRFRPVLSLYILPSAVASSAS